MKKNILFMVKNMNIGGTEKALLNMIAEMPRDEYEITIYMLERYGGFLEHIPKEVKVEYMEGFSEIKDTINEPPFFTAKKLLKEGKLTRAFQIAILHVLSKITKNRSHFFKYLLRQQPNLKKEYDIAVAYAGPMDFISYFVVHKIKAKKKIQWIHFDITKIGFNSNFAKKLYNEFHQIFVVSEEAKDKFLEKVPSVCNKTQVFNNIISKSLIISQSMEGNGFTDQFNGIRILTVGRLTTEKGQDLAIKAFAKLIKDGYNVRWYCIGEGSSRKKYEQMLIDYNLQQHFIFLGANTNPYPYMKQCDIYVQPSRYEGYCITLMEARCLKKPIITTDVNGAREQIKSGNTGLIVKIDEVEIYKAIRELLDNNKLTSFICKNLDKEEVNSSRVIRF